MRTTFSAAALCFAFSLMAAGSTARADVLIDFEDIAVAPGSNVIGGDRTSTGHVFDTLTNHTHLANGSFGADNGSTYLVTDDFLGENPLTMTPLNGEVFRLLSVDIAEWNTLDSTAQSVTVTGNLDGGGTVTETFTLDLIFDGTGSAVDFQSFTFDASWTNLTSVVFKGNDSLTGDDYFALDNIRVDVVPEPSALVLSGVGLLLGLGYARRRGR